MKSEELRNIHRSIDRGACGNACAWRWGPFPVINSFLWLGFTLQSFLPYSHTFPSKKLNDPFPNYAPIAKIQKSFMGLRFRSLSGKIICTIPNPSSLPSFPCLTSNTRYSCKPFFFLIYAFLSSINLTLCSSLCSYSVIYRSWIPITIISSLLFAPICESRVLTFEVQVNTDAV